MKNKIFYTTIDKFNEIVKYVDRPESVGEIKKSETAEIWYHHKDGEIKIKKINLNKIKVSLENPSQGLKENIEKIIKD